MEKELRDMLRDRATELMIQSELSDTTRSRVHRKRAFVAVSSMAAVVIAIASIALGVRSLTGVEGVRPEQRGSGELRVTASATVGSLQWMAASGESLWLTGSKKLIQMDASLNEIRATDFQNDTQGFAVHGSLGYLVRGEQLVKLNTATHEVVKTFDFPGFRPSQVAVSPDGRTVWVTAFVVSEGEDLSGRVYRLDPEVPEAPKYVSVLSPGYIVATNGAAWVTYDRGLLKLDGVTGQIVGEHDSNMSTGTSNVARAGEDIWIEDRINGNSGAFKIDPDTLKVVARFNGPVAIAASGTSVWVRAILDSTTIVELDSRDGTVRGSILLDFVPRLLTANETGLFAAAPTDDTRTSYRVVRIER